MSRTTPIGLDLAEIRRELDLLVVARRNAELSPQLHVRYLELCELETLLLKTAS